MTLTSKEYQQNSFTQIFTQTHKQTEPQFKLINLVAIFPSASVASVRFTIFTFTHQTLSRYIGFSIGYNGLIQEDFRFFPNSNLNSY